MANATHIPEGYNTVTVSLVVPEVGAAMAFYQKAFGAEPAGSMRGPDGKSIVHAEIKIGDSAIMLGPESEMWGSKSPKTLGGTPVSMHLYVPDADAAFARAVQAGCEVIYPLENTFWGDRYGKVKDPYGHSWGLGTRRETLTEAEIERRGQEWMKKMAASHD